MQVLCETMGKLSLTMQVVSISEENLDKLCPATGPAEQRGPQSPRSSSVEKAMIPEPGELTRQLLKDVKVKALMSHIRCDTCHRLL